MTKKLAPLPLLLAAFAIPTAPAVSEPAQSATAAKAAAAAAAAAKKYSVPKCPRKYKARTSHWRGWYACHSKRARKRWARPTGCRGGYVLWVRKLRSLRAWRCKPKTAPPPTNPQNPSSPQPAPTPQANDRLMRLAFEFAKQVGQQDIDETHQTTERIKYDDWWINADVRNGVFYPQFYPNGHVIGYRVWPEGCTMVGVNARCTLVQREYNAIPDSTFVKYIAVRRKYVFALDYGGGNVQYRWAWKSTDDPGIGAPWYYTCAGPPQLYSNVPVCTY